MNNENNSTIHEFDFSLICEYFSSIDRQGPGSKEATLKALSFIEGLDARSRIADLGCGTGGQTVTLAQNSPASITALDLFPLFIDKLNERASRLNLTDRISGITGSMDDLPFSEEEFNVIWSEGAIYNIGFRKGLQYWYKFLKKNGYIAVTEACWLTDSRPQEIEDFWMDAYPEIDTIPSKTAQLQEVGYESVVTFTLPEKCWTENFYVPQIEAQKKFLSRHDGDAVAEELVKYMRHEDELYSRFKQYYGYVFFIGKKIS